LMFCEQIYWHLRGLFFELSKRFNVIPLFVGSSS
jgi:hypothetical protein